LRQVVSGRAIWIDTGHAPARIAAGARGNGGERSRATSGEGRAPPGMAGVLMAAPRTPRRALRDFVPVAAALALCPLAAALAPGDPSAAIVRARAIAAVERDLGVFAEPAVHGWAGAHGWLLALAGAFYIWVHLPAAIGALVWAWLERPHAFRAARDTFVLAQALTILGAIALPTAPPRMLPELGFADTLAGLWGTGAAGAAHSIQSPYAAMPSGHVAFALVAGGTVAWLARPLTVRALAAAYPPLVVLVTVATANHFVLDAAAAALVVALAALVAARRPGTRSPAPSRSADAERVRPALRVAVGRPQSPAHRVAPGPEAASQHGP
jgi:PAP2 superfamily